MACACYDAGRMLALEWDLTGWEAARDARDLFGSGVRIIARHNGEGFSFAAADLSRDDVTVRRSAVTLGSGDRKQLLAFDIASAPFAWSFGGAVVHVLQAPPLNSETPYALASTLPCELVRGVDLVGALWNDWVVLFHTGLNAAQSSLSFDSKGGWQYLLTGLGPGSWDVWRDGWLEEMAIPIRPPTASLRFTGEPGSFFIRKFG